MASQAPQAPPNTMQKLLTVQEAAAFLNVSKSTVYRYAERSELPHIKLRLGLRFRSQDLDKWIAQSKREACSIDKNLTKILTSSSTGYKKVIGGNTNMANPKKGRLNCGFGSVYLRPTKSGKARFYLDYYDAEGNRRQELEKTAATWEDAALSLQKKQQAVRDK